jgi:hypothetical protein
VVIVPENNRSAEIINCLIIIILSLTIFSCIGTENSDVPPRSLHSIEIAPVNPSIAKDYYRQFTATGTFSDNSRQDITTAVTWSSSNTSVVIISNAAGSNGLATAVAGGSATIRAASGGVSGSTTCTVTDAVLISIAVAPTNSKITVGHKRQFTATGTFSDNSTQDITAAVTWSSSDTSIATISNTAGSNGLAAAAGIGSATITATAGTITGSTICTVTAIRTVDVDVWQTFDFDTLSVANLDANDHSNEGAWAVDNDGEATMSASGERAAPAAFNGQQDVGGYGLRYGYLFGDLPQSGCARYIFASNKSAFTAGFWLYVPDEVGVYGEHDVFTIIPFNSARGTYIKLGDVRIGAEMWLMIMQVADDNVTGVYSAAHILLDPYNRWYWISLSYVQNGYVKVSAYDESLNFVGELIHQNRTVNVPINNVWIGSLIGPSNTAMHKVLYWDDFVLNWTNPQYPIDMKGQIR